MPEDDKKEVSMDDFKLRLLYMGLQLLEKCRLSSDEKKEILNMKAEFQEEMVQMGLLEKEISYTVVEGENGERLSMGETVIDIEKSRLPLGKIYVVMGTSKYNVSIYEKHVYFSREEAKANKPLDTDTRKYTVETLGYYLLKYQEKIKDSDR